MPHVTTGGHQFAVAAIELNELYALSVNCFWETQASVNGFTNAIDARSISNFDHIIAGRQHGTQRGQYFRKCLQQYFLPAIAEPYPDYLRRDTALPGGKRLKIFVLGDDGEPAFFGVLPDCSVIG